MSAQQKRRSYARGWEPKFLTALADLGGNVTAASEASAVSRDAVYSLLNKDTERGRQFRADYEAAMETARDRLEKEAHRRAVEGWDEPVYQKGEMVGTVRRYSDRMLELLLKAKIPEQYRERFDLRVKTSTSEVDEEIERLADEISAKGAGSAVPQE